MIYVYLAEGFEETEAIAPIDLLRRAGLEVYTVGVTGKVVTGSHGIPVVCDKTADEISLSEVPDMIVLPGGMPGTRNLEASVAVQAAMACCAENGKFIGAICAAPSIPGHKGLLRGKRAVCYPGFEDALDGAQVLTCPTVTDGQFITARGAGAAVAFGLALVEALCGEKKAQELKHSIVG